MLKNKSDFSEVKVLLLDCFSRQTLAITEALYKIGCHVTTYNSSKLDPGYLSRYPDKRIIGFWDTDDEKKSGEALLEVLKAEHYDVTIPLTDFSATLLSRNKEAFEAYTHAAVNDWGVFIKAADKLNTMNACMDNGIPCPKTLRSASSVEEIINSEICYPLAIKPRVGYGSIGFHCINNEEELRKCFDACVTEHGPMLVQEYIPQSDLQYKCEVFIGEDGEAKSAHVFDKTRWYPVDGGSTCCSTSVDRPDIIESCVKLLKSIGWRGYGDIDLIQDPRDHIAKIMEINPRITASVKVCIYSGVDFARQIVEYETGRPVTEYKSYKTGICLRYMHTDLLWFIESPDRFKAKPSWFSWRYTTDQIWNPKDPLPWFGYTFEGLAKFGKEKRKRKR